jgi:iron complex outermembrane receptor protein
VELLSADPAAQFTAPNWISNRFTQVSLSGNLAVSDTASIQAVTYYNSLVQKVSNGNAANDTPCNDGSGLLCADSGPSTTLGRSDPGVRRSESVLLFGVGQPES